MMSISLLICKPQNWKPMKRPHHLILTALVCLWTMSSISAHAQEEDGTCARVKIELSQKAAITRTAFQATLSIGNSPVNVPLEKFAVTLDIRDANGNPANDKFGIGTPVLKGISDVTGTGTVAPGAQAVATWTILPTRDAAPSANAAYTIGGTITYVQGDTNVSIPLFAAPITVVPDPLLQFHYFLQHDVYGDDPFTEAVEPTEPFSLGLLAVNAGYGAAHNLTVTSSQPKIVDNEKGLQVGFQIIGSRVNDHGADLSLTLPLGDIVAGGTSVGDFLLISTLQGKFIDFSAAFKHLDDLNNPRTSILDSVDTHFLEHVVRVVDPADDKKPDFLAYSDIAPVKDELPIMVWNSDGTTAPVAATTNVSVDGAVSNDNLSVRLTAANIPAGFVYIRANDPGNHVYNLTRVVRSDGREISLGDNAWTTHRIIRLKGQAPYPENRVYLFDGNNTGGTTLSYTLSYAPLIPIAPVVTLTAPGDGATFSPNSTVSLAATASSVQASVRKVDFYADNTMIGTSAAAPFRLDYTPRVGAHSLYAVATDENGTMGQSATARITVNAAANKPPVITLVNPVNGANPTAPATITLSAVASDPDGSVAKVDFYRNGEFLGSSVSAPYTVTLDSMTPGTYLLAAVATDNQGATATSKSVGLTVDPQLTQTGLPLLRVVSVARQATPGQVMITIENSGSMNAASVAIVASKTKWGGFTPTNITGNNIALLAPNSTSTLMLQFPAGATGAFMTLSGTFSGRSFGGLTRVTP